MKFEELVNPLLPQVLVTGRDGFGPRKKNLTVRYESRKNTGVAKVVGGYDGETGSWVVLADRERDVFVTVRPTQVKPA